MKRGRRGVTPLKLGVLAGVLLLAAIPFHAYLDSEPNHFKSGKPLIWGGPKNISMLPLVAERKGFFKVAGIDVKANFIQTGKIAMDALISGDLDLAIIVDTNIAFVKFQEGADLKVLTSITEKHDDAIIARKDRGIRKPQDLEGKALAILPGTTSHRFADLFIDFYHLDRKKIQFLSLSPPSIQAGILNGNIEAGSIWQPYRYNVLRELGERAIEFKDQRIYTAYSLIAARTKIAAERREDIINFLKALIQAEEYIKTHKDDAIAIISQELDVQKDVLEAVWNEYDLSVRLDEGLVRLFSDEGHWIVRTQKGFEGKTVPSYQDVLYPGILKNIDPVRIQPAH